MKTSRRRLNVDVEELDRVIDAAEDGPLSKSDCQKLKTTLHALVERLAPKRNTEKTNSVLEPKSSSSTEAESAEPKPAGHGRNAASAFTGAEKVSVQHAQLKPGDSCPECREGRVYRQKEPKTLIRIVGQAPLKATVFERERLRCNGCCQVFTAAEPPAVGTDKYDTSAVAMIALLKYGTGVPFNRMERLETQLGIPLPAATQWELMEAAAKQLKRIMSEFIRQAAQGSAVLLERYVTAAGKIARLAVGDVGIRSTEETYEVRQDLTQNDHIDGLPLGTRGGVVVRHDFPVDGEYSIKVELLKGDGYAIFGQNKLNAEQLTFILNGESVHLSKLSVNEARNQEALQIRIPVKAGPQSIGVAFLKRDASPLPGLLEPFLRSTSDTDDTNLEWPHVASVIIDGPFKVSGPGDTPSRRRIFLCQPAKASDELPCARQIVSTLARRAYRRPVSDADLEELLNFYQKGRNEGSFDKGVEMALQRILSSPQFMFRFERDPAGIAAETPYRLSDLELASRMAFFLWSSLPDDELLDLASHGKLKNPAVLEHQTRRMLADPRAQSLVTDFAGQWLYLRNLQGVTPDIKDFPDFDDNLRQAMQRETELFFGSIMQEDRSVLTLLNGDYKFLNERLAKHYGIPNVIGPQFRRVQITDDARKGLLGLGSILTVTSYATRTSPVVRGKWVMENLLGTPPPNPPPNVPPLKENTAGQASSVRERMELHRANPVCASCHKVMDPIGFSLENYDAIGRWRTRTEANTPVDASGQLANGAKIDGPASLAAALLAHPDQFAGTLTEKLLTYALGRGLAYYDMPVVRSITKEAGRDNYRFSALILGVIRSQPFQMKMSPGREESAAPAGVRASARQSESGGLARAGVVPQRPGVLALR